MIPDFLIPLNRMHLFLSMGLFLYQVLSLPRFSSSAPSHVDHVADYSPRPSHIARRILGSTLKLVCSHIYARSLAGHFSRLRDNQKCQLFARSHVKT